MPGLGHVYIGRLARALIWFIGSLMVAGIAGGADADRWLPLAIVGVLAICAAVDAWLLIRFEGQGRRS